MTDRGPVVSVLVTVYDREAYLGKPCEASWRRLTRIMKSSLLTIVHSIAPWK